jgi:hypothetical protein
MPHLNEEQMAHYISCLRCKTTAIKRMVAALPEAEKVEAAKRMAKVVLP